MARLANVERAQPFRRFVRHVEVRHGGAARPAAAPLDEPLDRTGVTLEDGFDRPVVAIPDPAGDAAHTRSFQKRKAKADTLDASVDDDAAADHRPSVSIRSRVSATPTAHIASMSPSARAYAPP